MKGLVKMKNKYQRMTKEEKKKCREKFYATAKGKEMKPRFTRLIIIGVIGIIFSLFLIISGYISKEINWATWVLAGILMVFSIIYIIGSIVLQRKCFNNFAVKHLK